MNGIFLLDKPQGFSSNHALQKVKRLFQAKKAGHTGSLDPLATGLLPICFGEATKFSQYLLDSDKKYDVVMQLGIRTATSDSEGEIISTRPVENISIEKINTIFDSFLGETQQIPSMFSALKHNGKPLYDYARRGITIDRPSRPIIIYALEVLSFENNQIRFTVHCSKGTYVRTIVDDVGEILGCGAHVIQLRRLSVGPYEESQMLTIEECEYLLKENKFPFEKYILPVDTSVKHFPEIFVSSAFAFALKQGKNILIPDAPVGFLRLKNIEGEFLGVGEGTSDGKIEPRRLVAQSR